MPNPGTLETIVAMLTEALGPLVEAANEDPAGSGTIALALEVGVDLTGVLTPAQAGKFAKAIKDAYDTVLGIVDDPSGFADRIPDALQAIQDFKSVIDTLDKLLPRSADLPLKLFNYLVYSSVEREAPVLQAVLQFGGVFKSKAGDTGGNVPPYVTHEIDWEQFPKLLSPSDVLHDLYGWGTANLDSNLLLSRIEAILWAIGIPSVYRGGGSPGTDGIIDLTWGLAFNGVMMPLGVEVAYLPAGSDLPGLSIVPTGTVSFSSTIPAPAGWQLTVALDASAKAGYGLSLRPKGGLTIGALPNQPPVSWTMTGKFGFGRTIADGESSIVLFGAPNGSRLEATAIGFKAFLQVGTDKGDAGIEFDITGGKAVVSTSESDGFLQKLLPAGGLSLDFDFGLGWSKTLGLYFTGNAGLEASFPLHLSLGPITLDTIYMKLLEKGSTINLETSLSAEGALGPISVSVEKIGFTADGEFQNGNLNFGMKFKAPSGLGLDIEATAVSGGGFIAFDTDKGEYSGELELTIEMLQLKAFGLLDTKPEVSFVIIIIADFPPIELGFGFALTGVGGLLGINRTMSIDALRSAFRNHSLDKTLFLEDPASQGGQVAQNIGAIFPIMDKHFVFGPFVQISWGEPILVSAELGFILTLPDPVRLAILGAIVAALPDPDTPIVILRLDVLGTIDFDKREIAIDASLYDSYVAAFSVAGDMAFRMNYGENPDFALSLGGLNPRFQPPPGFPTLKRLSISLGDSDNPRISVEGYLAITSNSVQFGAQAELTASAAGFGIHGYESFDALVMLKPFGFTIDFHAGIDLLHGSSVIMSIGVDGTLSGTSPWHIHGDGHIHVLFFDVSVSFDATFGQSAPLQNPPTVTVIDKFTATLQDARSWQALMPPDAGRVATLAAIRPTPEMIVIHPIGQLKFEQTLLPLDVQLAKFGSANISDANQFTVSGLVLNGAKKPLTDTNTIPGEFADAQFFNLSDDDKISKPSFTSHDAGASFDAGALTVPALDVKETVVYNTIIWEDDMQPTKTGKKYALTHDKALSMTGFGASAMNSRRSAGAQKYVPSGMKSGVTVNSPSYVVVNKTDMTVRKDISSSAGAGYASVQSRLSAYVAKNPSSKGALEIVPKYELPAR